MLAARAATLAFAAALALAGEAGAVECPSVTYTRISTAPPAAKPAPHKRVHRSSPAKRLARRRAAVQHRRAKHVRSHAAPAKPRLAPTVVPTPPASAPATVAAAVPSRSVLKPVVQMVACEAVTLQTAAPADLIRDLATPIATTGLIPASASAPPELTLLEPEANTPVNPATFEPWLGPTVFGGRRPPVLGGIPEPTTWAMLITGLFGLGSRLRQTRTAARRRERLEVEG